MDQFEQARLRAQKRLERQARQSQPSPELVQAPPPEEAPKEKEEKEPDNSATISVWVQLPDQAFAMKFTKPGVYQNAIKSKLTKQGISNAIKDGLRPLLGGLSEV